MGRTPLADVRLPNGVGIFRFELDGRATVLRALRNPGMELSTVRDRQVMQSVAGANLTVPLPAANAVPPGMVLVPGSKLPVPLVSDEAVAIAPYFLGRYEVTDRQSMEFVDAGGYKLERLWRDRPFGTAAGSWREAVARFVDSTGRPGPSTWESGSYPDGMGDHSVTGVSWFEANAYARFRERELPTAYHWYRAAFSLYEITGSISAAVVRRGNFQGRGTEPVGRRLDIGPYGTSTWPAMFANGSRPRRRRGLGGAQRAVGPLRRVPRREAGDHGLSHGCAGGDAASPEIARGVEEAHVFDVGHGWVPQNQFVSAALDWYDQYLGPVR